MHIPKLGRTWAIVWAHTRIIWAKKKEKMNKSPIKTLSITNNNKKERGKSLIPLLL